MELTKSFGTKVFSIHVMRERLPQQVFEKFQQQINNGEKMDTDTAEAVAEAMKVWALEQGATHYAHWFQPMTGATAGKLDAFLTPDGEGGSLEEFSAKNLIKGEPDASSFPSGGLRATFEARGYTAWDPTSPAFVKENTLFIPSAFGAFTGEALDAKTPLLRSMDVLSKQAVKLLRIMGYDDVTKVVPMAGAEQEYFIIDRPLAEKRLDIKNCGSTLFGAPMSGQVNDHYFGHIKLRIRDYMAEVDRRLWELGIPAKTKHNESAPSQEELASVYENCNLSCDHNQQIMEILRAVAKEKNLYCLLNEKPFAYVNGSGKHNNYSLQTDTGINMMSDKGVNGDDAIFIVTLCALLRGIDNYSELLRLSTASAENDCRLGGNEAPPAIISICLGDNLVDYLYELAHGKTNASKHKAASYSLGLSTSPDLTKDDCDRNRTSPFAISNGKFEFRMLGSSQSIALCNTVLNTILADGFRVISTYFEEYDYTKQSLSNLVATILKDHGRIIFNGNNYSKEWEAEAKRRNLPIIRDTVSAVAALHEKKNTSLFSELGVLTEAECASRASMMMDAYTKAVSVKASTMIEMTRRQILPALLEAIGKASNEENAYKQATGSEQKYLLTMLGKMDETADEIGKNLELLESKMKNILADEEKAATYMRDEVLPVMQNLRAACDKAETLVERKIWPFPTYTDLLKSL